MTLLDACEPLFRRICELNRQARTGGITPDYITLRSEMQGLLDGIRNTFLADPGLERHWPHLELPLIFFVDSMISESKMPAAAEWNNNRLAYARKELAGDEKFFDMLDQNLKDSSSDASARLGFYYTCIGLGFTGWYSGQPEPLRNRMLEMLPRVDARVRADNHLPICPEAYEAVDTRDLIEPPPIPIRILVILFLGLLLIVLTITVLFYQEATIPMRRDLFEIISHSLGN